jgi:hypothetical protein
MKTRTCAVWFCVFIICSCCLFAGIAAFYYVMFTTSGHFRYLLEASWVALIKTLTPQLNELNVALERLLRNLEELRSLW